VNIHACSVNLLEGKLSTLQFHAYSRLSFGLVAVGE